MFDFVKIETIQLDEKKTKYEIAPKFIVKRSKDLMIRGKAFYAVWNENSGMWCTDEDYITDIIDSAITEAVKVCKNEHPDAKVRAKYLSDFSSNKWTEWQKYVKSIPDNYHELDTKITFSNTNVKKTDYVSKRLAYDIVDDACPAYDELMSVLYSPEERQKLEWSIGAIIAGDSKHIQKFMVLYGPPRSGKSTFLHIIEKLFDGYYTTFEAKALGSVNNPFALEAFKDNPLIAIQHDGDLSKIEDNTKINQIVAHEDIVVNEKFKATYATHFNTFLYLGTNSPVKITNSKSGIIRRLIDVTPTGNTVPKSRYDQLRRQIKFELGAIANHCLQLYLKLGESYYDGYVSNAMISATNDLYNFLEDYRFEIKDRDEITFAEIWRAYKLYCQDANITYPMKRTPFKEELKYYFEEHKERTSTSRDIYRGLILSKFKSNMQTDDKEEGWLKFDNDKSDFDEWCKDKGFKAQYDTGLKKPIKAWDYIHTTMEDIDSHKLHWINIPIEENHIRIDFDFKDASGNKCLERNIDEANKFPPTYAEISKSGGGVHLHYFYDGDVTMLNPVYSEHIEIKTDKGNSGCRRMLTKCNDIPMATLHVGSLPLKEEKKVVTDKEIMDEKKIRNLIKKNLRKEIHPATKPSIDFIKKILDDAYASGISYDVSDMFNDILVFGANSSNQSQTCIDLVSKMHFCSEDNMKKDTPKDNEDKPIAFFDVEVFPNVFILCWKYAGDATVTRMINPRPSEVSWLFKNLRLIGFNNRRYDNHICWAWIQGYSNKGLYDLSQSIINTKKGEKCNGFFGQAYNASYLDVYDLASNPNKMSLKKWEIKLHIHHLENSYPWDQDLPEDKWLEVAEYCANDVMATEATYDAIMGDVAARLILAKISGLLPNDTTNNHSMQIIFGDDMNPQSQFVYTKLSVLFPGYKFDNGISTYRGYVVGEGGFVWAKPGMYRKVKTFDVASMHPSSLIALNLFGDIYTKRFKEIKDARLAVKHKDRKALETLLDGQLLEFYDIAVVGEQYTLKDLATALKTVINSVYGLTAAGFKNRCRDPRNVDNIVAKRGALFMVNLLEEVKARGGNVIHIKTDSIKVVDPSPELEAFIISYGKEYGYDFEVESIYDRICLVNDAVYIAKEDGEDGEWTATGDEFKVPYVFKSLFSGEEVDIYDLAETINVSKGELYLDYNEGLPENEHGYQFVGKISSFLPIKPGHGGAELRVKRDDKYSYASGTKGRRWLETEYVKETNKIDDIDTTYYAEMAGKAIAHINEFGNFDKFVNDPDYDPYLEKCLNVPEDIDEEVPFDEDKIIV